MTKKDITSFRTTIEWLSEQPDEVITVKGQVDPVYQISGIEKALEGGPVLVFENIKGYPGVRAAGNVLSKNERKARIFDVEDPRKLKFKFREAINKPLPPRIVNDAPCQEVVITEGMDAMATIPFMKQTEGDGGRFLTGGNSFLSGRYFDNGTHLSMNRMHFRGKDWASISTTISGHLEETLALIHRGEKVPVTINIGTPPACMITAAGAPFHAVLPHGVDEVGIAGALQGTPVEIVKAKTVDAYSIAKAEWVIEGYIDSSQKIWETEESEKSGKQGLHPFFPEWTGYLGRAYKVFKFQATAITHRKDRPIFWTPLSFGIEGEVLGNDLREATLFELAERMFPGFVKDVCVFTGLQSAGGMAIQVKKRRAADEGFQRNLIQVVLGSTNFTRLLVVVDDDVDIYRPEELIWAIGSRVDPSRDIIHGLGRGHAFMPLERGESAGALEFHGMESIGFDATVPIANKWRYERARYPKMDLSQWFTKTQLDKIRAGQTEFARFLGDSLL